jgi:tRNA(fMet)-specific endonuclease VapC
MTFLDTDLIVGLLRGDADAVAMVRHLEEKGDRPKVTVISEYELLKGASTSKEREANLSAVRRLLGRVKMVGLLSEHAESAADVYAKAKKTGRMLDELDILIAGSVMPTGETLVTRDAHFGKIEGLKLERW